MSGYRVTAQVGQACRSEYRVTAQADRFAGLGTGRLLKLDRLAGRPGYRATAQVGEVCRPGYRATAQVGQADCLCVIAFVYHILLPLHPFLY